MEEWIVWGHGEKEELEHRAKRLLKFNHIIDTRIVSAGLPEFWTLEYLMITSWKDGIKLKQTTLTEFGEGLAR